MAYRRALIVFATLATVAATQPLAGRPARRAAPSVIVFSGAPLHAPIVLSDWSENQRLMLAATTLISVPESVLKPRLRIHAALYWGAEWSRYAATPDSLALLAKIGTAQQATYYPATSHESAVWVFGPAAAMPSSARLLSPEGVAILHAHHLPAAGR
jgi:hypothetical protein